MLRSDCVNSGELRRDQKNSWNQKKRFAKEVILRLACIHTRRMSPHHRWKLSLAMAQKSEPTNASAALSITWTRLREPGHNNSDFTHEAVQGLFLPRSTRDYPRLPLLCNEVRKLLFPMSQ